MAEVTISFITPSMDGEKIKIELDAEANGDGKKVFRYGETAYFRAYGSTTGNLRAVTSDGVITSSGSGTATVSAEFLSFVSSNEAETKFPVKALVSAKWLGNSLGAVTKAGTYSMRSEKGPDAEGENGIGICEVSYTTGYKRFGITLSKRTRDEYPVLIYVYPE
jgi:hypothetical protein